MQKLKDKFLEIRAEMLRVALKNKVGHIAPALSCLHLLVALHYKVMGKNDVCVLSKGHAALAEYAILHDKGKIQDSTWENYELPGCLERHTGYGIPCSTGSLGHGLPMAVGIAFARKIWQKPGHVYCIVGDGEFLGEGSCTEALNFISRFKLQNMTCIVDNNRFQAMTTLPFPIESAWPHAVQFDGHDMEAIVKTLEKNRYLVIARTIKGKGLSFQEGIPEWHYKVPETEDEISEINLLISSAKTKKGSCCT